MPTVTERGMGLGLRALNGLAGLELIDRIGLRKPVERIVFEGSKTGFRTAATAGRAFKATSRLSGPTRQQVVSGAGRGLFDLTPTDEQQMIQEAFAAFAADAVRPAARTADDESLTPKELFDSAVELGAPILGVPEELGGATSERSAVTAVLAAEKLAHGDLGIAAALLAPGGVATALALFGDADQQATYLPPFTGEDVPAAAVAILEPGALFDPFALQTTAHRSSDGGFVLRGVKALVPRASECELFVVGAMLDGAPRLFLVEAAAGAILTEPEPAMGLRPASTGRVYFEDSKLPAGALLGTAEDYAEAVRRARLAWCALSVGTAQAVLDHLIPYVNERVAFGEPISHRQAVAFTISDVAIEVGGMRLTTYRAAARADAGKPFARETALARRLCAEKGMQIGSAGVQMLGGHGYVKEYPVERWYRDLRAAGVLEGALLV